MLVELKDINGSKFFVNPQRIDAVLPVAGKDNVTILFGGTTREITMEMFFYFKGSDGLGMAIYTFNDEEFELAKKYRKSSSDIPAPTAFITPNETEISGTIGDTGKITYDSGYLTEPVVILSTQPDTVSVDSEGNYELLKEGIAVITLNSGSVAAMVTVTSVAPPVPLITPSVSSYDLTEGEDVEVSYTSENLTDEVVITVADPTFATYAEPNLSGVAEGNTELVFTSGAYELRVPINVSASVAP